MRAIVTSRDRLRESPVSTKYIDVTIEPPSPDENSSYSDGEDQVIPSTNEFIDVEFPGPVPFVRRSNSEVFHRVLHPVPMPPPPPPVQTDFEGHIEGPINPVNYSGTQINVWGIPPPNLGGFLDSRRPKPVEQAPPEPVKQQAPPQNERKLGTHRFGFILLDIITLFLIDFLVSSLPETLRKFFKQVQRLYERDSEFQSELDGLVENGQVV